MARTPPPFCAPVLSEERVPKSTWYLFDNCPDPALKLMASAFYTRANADLLMTEILQLISRRRKYALFKELAFIGYIDPAFPELEFFFATQRSIDHYLLFMLFNTAVSPLTPIQKTVCLTLFIFVYTTIVAFEPYAAYTRALTELLKEHLDQSPMSTFWAPSYDLCLWVVFIGAHISKGQRERPWFITQVARGIRLLALQDLHQMRETLLGFFYIDRFHDKSLREIWNEAHLIGEAFDMIYGTKRI